jgi:hypothetical protein
VSLTRLHVVFVLVVLLLVAGGCRNKCATWCHKWTECQKAKAEKAGIDKFESNCVDKCESGAKSTVGYERLNRKLECVATPCQDLTRCLREHRTTAK